MAYPTTKKLRPLHIRFDSYGAADDSDFKYDLIVLMTGSIRELKSAASKAHATRQSDIFKKAAHKAKSTLTLIDDKEFTQVVEDYNIEILKDNSAEERITLLDKFYGICESIIESLDWEAHQLKQKI